MNHRSSSLNKFISSASLNLSNYSNDSDEYSDNNSDPGFQPPKLFNQRERQLPFKFQKVQKKGSRVSISNQNMVERKKKILVLDLDDTLIHSIEATANNQSPITTTKAIMPPKIKWKVKLDQKIIEKLPKNIMMKDETSNKSSNQNYFYVEYNIINLKYHNKDFYVCERPNVRQFLQNICNLFDVYIYTSSEKRYAKPIIDELCPMIDDKHRKYGDLCKVKYNRIYKDLYSFDCSFSDILIVDDNPENFFFWPKNTILCKPFNFKSKGNIKDHQKEDIDNVGDENHYTNLNFKSEDIALFIDQNYLMGKLLPILVRCSLTNDVRKVINSQKAMNINQFSENNNGVCFIGNPNQFFE